MDNVPDRSLAPAAAPSFVGRGRERRLLGDRLRTALNGHGSLVLVGGAAGMGKTALARAIGDEAAEQDFAVLTGQCYDLVETPPYGPWRELLADAPPVPGMSLPAPFAADARADDTPSQLTIFARVQDYLTALATRQPLLLVLGTCTGPIRPASICCAFSAAPCAPHRLSCSASTGGMNSIVHNRSTRSSRTLYGRPTPRAWT
jgi:hypothetical protein